MSEDSIVEDIHRVRRELAAEFNDDVHAFFAYLRNRVAKREDHAVTLQPVLPTAPSKSTASK
jgi:hypothetical protein